MTRRTREYDSLRVFRRFEVFIFLSEDLGVVFVKYV